MKRCANPDCAQLKEPSCFGKDSRRKDGLKPYCKACTRAKYKDYSLRNPDKLKLKRQRDSEKMKVYCRERYEAKREEILEKNRKYYKENSKLVMAQNRPWREKNPEKIKEYANKYARSEKGLSRNRLRYKTDLQFRLKMSLRSRTGMAIRGSCKAGSAVDDLGCTVEFLKEFLESKFQPGMTWDNWGRYGWHIDHIIPLSSFDLTDREQFLKACHYTNLQPLWAEDNMKKSNKTLKDAK